MNINDIARICHEANKAYCDSLGDPTQKHWFEAPKWQKESAVDGVQFHIDNPNASDAASHENWLKGKEGWVQSEEKIPERKMHPCIMPFKELPKEQQFKDKLFKSICTVMIPLLD